MGRPRLHPPTCTVQGCDHPHLARGFCRAHYKRYMKYGDPQGGNTPVYGAPPTCWAAGCSALPVKHDLCRKHHRMAERRFARAHASAAG